MIKMRKQSARVLVQQHLSYCASTNNYNFIPPKSFISNNRNVIANNNNSYRYASKNDLFNVNIAPSTTKNFFTSGVPKSRGI